MRILALSTMLALGFVVGCEKPMEETFPSPTSGSSSGTTDAAADATDAAPEASDKPAEGATPAAEAAATETPAAEKPAEGKPAAEAPAAEAPASDKPAAETVPVKEGSAANATTSAAKLVAATLKVPTMACPHGCWPTVKETLAKQPGVETVELAKQANETEIDNPQVNLKLNGKFDVTAAIAALAAAGFADAKLVP